MDFSLKVLVVDDVKNMRDVMLEILDKIGFKNIDEAENGKEAYNLVEKQNGEYGIILCDWNMPIMTGIDFLRKIKEHEKYADIPFIMVTAESEKDNILEAVTLGISNYIVKPVDSNDLKEKIYYALGEEGGEDLEDSSDLDQKAAEALKNQLKQERS